MIYVIPDGGLCNRMRVIASYKTKVKECGTSLTVLWMQSDIMGCGFYDLFSEIEGISVVDDYQEIKKYVDKFTNKKHYFHECAPNAELRSTIDKMIADREEICVRTCYINGVQDWSIFKPNITVLQKINSISLNENTVGVHIRRTDQLASIRVSPTELFIQAMLNEIKQDSGVQFYLATDDLEEEKLLRWYFGDRIISIKDKSFSRSDVEGTQDALVDLYRLSMCKKLYGSFNSSFTDGAHIWNRKKDLVLIDNGRPKKSVGAIYREGSYEWSYEKSVQAIKKMLSFQQMLVFINCMYTPQARLSFCTKKQVYQSYLNFMEICQPYNLKNTELLRIGGENYGGHVMADILEPGIVVSVGNFYDDWNYQMAERGFFVYKFVDNSDKPLNPHSNINFERVSSYDMKYMLAKAELSDNEVSVKNSILQIDLRGGEWKIFNDMSGRELKCFKQMVIDFHDLLSEDKIDRYTEVLKKLNKTHQVVHIHYNNNVSMLCFNNFVVANVIRLTYVRRDVGEFYPATHAFPTPLDNPTDKGKQEVFIGKFTDILTVKDEYDKGNDREDDLKDISWRDLYYDAVQDMEWIRKKNIYHGSHHVYVGYMFIYVLCHFLDEYNPKKILEFNFDQVTKITAQYASSHESALTVLADNRERVEHLLGCWGIPWSNTIIQGSELVEVRKDKYTGVAYRNFHGVTQGKKYNLILLKSPMKQNVRIHLDILSGIPEIIDNDFAILMDHVEDECGQMVFQEMMYIFKKHGIKFMRKDFSAKNRLVSILFSESWKYIADF